MDETLIRELMRKRLAERLEIAVDTIQDDQVFDAYGLDSVTAIELTYELETRLGHYVSPGILFEYNTITKLARHLAADNE